MEYSRALTKVTRVLLPREQGYCRVFELFDSERNWWVINCELNLSGGKKYLGTGTGRDRLNSFFRACIESGECEISELNSWNSRSGVAGGLLLPPTVQRAKEELLERDAFLYHYRTREPFIKLSHREDPTFRFDLYQMNCASRDVFAYIAILSEGAECLQFGLGASLNRDLAVEKAVNELRSIVLDHKIRNGYCKRVFESCSHPRRLADFHHAQSRDPRNQKIFSELVSGNQTFVSRNVRLKFDVEHHKSSLRFVKYAKVRSDNLIELKFGEPETALLAGGPLFHPVW